MKKFQAALLSTLILLSGCNSIPQTRQQKISIIIGVDVSGSFYNSGNFQNALDFLAHYIYGHINQVGQLRAVKTMFVGSIGGNSMDEAKSFHPIQDFEGKSIDQIRSDLERWFPKSDAFTDFNVFFKQAALIAQKRNLSLSPIEIVLLTDGIPDVHNEGDKQGRYDNLDVSPLEYLSRNTTLRLLYPSPVVAKTWETTVPRKRVRMWTVDNQVMVGWKNQMKPGLPLHEQDKFLGWLLDNVEFRVQPMKFLGNKKKKA